MAPSHSAVALGDFLALLGERETTTHFPAELQVVFSQSGHLKKMVKQTSFQRTAAVDWDGDSCLCALLPIYVVAALNSQ